MSLLSIFKINVNFPLYICYQKKVNIGILKSKFKASLLCFTSGAAEESMDAFRKENCSYRLFCYINLC